MTQAVTSSLAPNSKNVVLGKPWMLTNDTLMSNVDSYTKAAIILEVKFAHLYFLDVINILKIDEESSGMIIEEESCTFTMAHLVEDKGLLASADGEWIEGEKPSLEYCLARF